MNNSLRCIAALALLTSWSAQAQKDIACTDIMPANLSQYGFHLKESKTYGDPDLGRGSTYEDADQVLRLSLYTYDLGYDEITNDMQMQTLEGSYLNMVETAQMRSLTFGDAYAIPTEYFQAMQTPLNIGIFTQSIGLGGTSEQFDEILAIGEHNGCIAKVRFTIPTQLNTELGDGDPLKPFYGVSRILFMSL